MHKRHFSSHSKEEITEKRHKTHFEHQNETETEELGEQHEQPQAILDQNANSLFETLNRTLSLHCLFRKINQQI